MSGFNLQDDHFDRPNNYRHICPYCGKEFFKRKNRIYCDDECKKGFNNEKAARKKERISVELRSYSNNAEFLHKHCIKPEVQIELSCAKDCGFNFTGPYKKVKDKQDANTWYQIGSFAYRIITEKNLMIIRKVLNE
jgi:predicted nucleic acid-binding Zn ribbon protein